MKRVDDVMLRSDVFGTTFGFKQKVYIRHFKVFVRSYPLTLQL